MAHISLRNPLVAGMAAAIGAGVVTVAPAAHVPALPITANVALAGFDNPITELLGTADLVQTYLTASYYNGGQSYTPGSGEANWPFAGFNQTGGDFLNLALAQEKGLGKYHNVGLIPEIVNTHQPILTQLISNWLGYLNYTLSNVIVAGSAVAEGVWNFPGAAIDAVKLALNGQVQAALTELVAAVTGPVKDVFVAAIDTVNTVVTDIFTNLVAVAKVIPTNLTLFGGWLLGGGQLLVKQAVATGTEWAQELGTGNFEGAWNTAVDGLLGPSGLPGTAFNLSLGAGVQTGPILTQADIKTSYIPSLRTAIQATFWNTQEALTTSAPGATASTPAPAAASEDPAEVPAAVASTPRKRLAERVATFKANAAHTAAAVEAPVKAHRAARADRVDADN